MMPSMGILRSYTQRIVQRQRRQHERWLGLAVKDDPRLALFWDKVGLGHSGQRLSDGGRMVIFVGGRRGYIPGPQGEAFLEQQQALLESRDKKRASKTTE